MAVGLHGVFLTHAGGLWRDEVGTVNLAAAPTLSALWNSLNLESFPALFHMVLRAWMRLGAGGDTGLRLFGCLLGLALTGALWWNARLAGYGIPFASIALVGANAVAIRATDSIRAYGLGSVLLLASFALTWRAVEAPTRWRVTRAGIVGVLAVQCLYQNAFLLLGVYAAGMAVALVQRRPKLALLFAGLGTAACLTIAPYVLLGRTAREFKMLIPYHLSLGRIGEVVTEALGSETRWIWAALILGGLLYAGFLQAGGSRHPAAARRANHALFCGVASLVGLLGFLVFLEILDLPTQAWYFLPPMALAGIALDGLCAAMAGNTALRLGRLALIGAALALTVPTTIQATGARQTNVDLIARDLLREAQTGDLIIVNPWYCGTTFSRYFHGRTPWTTIPPLADYRIQRVDLFKRQMVAVDPLGRLRDGMAATLSGGHRVWLVGGLPFPGEGQEPPDLPPAPASPVGWDHDAYASAWAAQMGYFLQRHGTQGNALPRPFVGPVNRFENLDVVVVEGWR